MKQKLGRISTLLLGVLALLGSVQVWSTPVTVVEYRVKALDTYFITGRANEIEMLDNLPDAFERTGVAFPAVSAGSATGSDQKICRFFYNDGSAVTHFYGIGSDCSYIRGVAATNPAFHDEGYDFALPPALEGRCDAAAPVVIRRMFRPASSGRMINHRYVFDAAVQNASRSEGYEYEGPTFCAKQVERIDALLARCPSDSELSLIRGRVNIQLSAALRAQPAVCGGQNLGEIERRVVQTLLALDRMRFARPLPWTNNASLLDWFTDEAKIQAMVIGESASSYCCSPANTIHIANPESSLLNRTTRWGDPEISHLGLVNTALLFVHEARHNQGKPHSCTLPGRVGTDDATLSELGAWGVQYYLAQWLSRYVDTTFVVPPLGEWPEAYLKGLGSTMDIALMRVCAPDQ